MGKKNDRISIIRKILSEELIGSQDELISRLADFGIKSTQSTLSRDFKNINISKMPHPDKGYIYVLSDQIVPETAVTTANLCDAILGIRFSGNIGVIATKIGYASAISVLVDSHKSKDILGTVAGENTILIVLREGASRDEVVEMLRNSFPMLQYFQ